MRRFQKILHNMGFSNYRDYLQSSLWWNIRTIVLSIHNYQCLLCPLRATQIHHISYSKKVLTGDDFSKLIPICHSCHESIEFSLRGKKRTITAAKKVFNSRWKKLPSWVRRNFRSRIAQHSRKIG